MKTAVHALVLSLLAACAGGGQRDSLCSQDSDCGTGQICTSGECTLASTGGFSFAPAALNVATDTGATPAAQRVMLSYSGSAGLDYTITCTDGVTASPATGLVSSGTSASIVIAIPMQSTAGTVSASCQVYSTEAAATASVSVTIVTTASSSGGGSGGGSAGGTAGGSGGGSAGGTAGGSGGGSAGGSAGGSGGGSAGGSAGGSGGGSAGGSAGGSGGGSAGGSAGGSGGGSAGGSAGGSGASAIINGDFESGLASWNSAGTTSVSSVAQSGVQSAQVGATTATGTSSVSQTFTVPSGAGPLTFWYQGFCNDTVTYTWATATLLDNTTSVTTTLLANTCTNTGQWVQVTSGALTAGDSVTLTLTNVGEVYMSDYNYTLFDDVQLSGSGSGGGSGGGSAGGSAGGSGGGSSGGSAGGSGGGSGGGSADGAPVRTATCTPFSQDTGTAINTTHGRLDGILDFVVPVGGSSTCNGDSGHIHLQITANGSIYDVAVDVGTSDGDALYYEANMAMPDGAWSEGWHNDALSYTSLGITSSQFTAPATPSAMEQFYDSELATVNHISVFGTAYSTNNGAHDIHYYNGSDGALVLQPLSGTPHLIFVRFSTDSF